MGWAYVQELAANRAIVINNEYICRDIELQCGRKRRLYKDRFECRNKVDGRITLIREHGKGASEFNVSFEYKMNNTPTHIDLIIVPVNEDTYRVGVAGYIKKNGKNYLDIADNDEAMCF